MSHRSRLSFCWCIATVLCLVSLSACQQQHHGLAPVKNGWYQPTATKSVHRVRTGETLYSIAWRYGYDYRDIAHTNHIARPYHLSIGQILRLNTQRTTPLPKKMAKLGNKHSRTQSKPSKPRSKLKQQRRRQAELGPIKHWVWPAKAKLLKRYAAGKLGNKGIDLAGPPGTLVVAAAPGRVVYAGSGLSAYGKLLIIKHNDQYLSAYAHNQRLWVKEGDRVKAKQRIATMGNSVHNLSQHGDRHHRVLHHLT